MYIVCIMSFTFSFLLIWYAWILFASCTSLNWLFRPQKFEKFYRIVFFKLREAEKGKICDFFKNISPYCFKEKKKQARKFNSFKLRSGCSIPPERQGCFKTPAAKSTTPLLVYATQTNRLAHILTLFPPTDSHIPYSYM